MSEDGAIGDLPVDGEAIAEGSQVARTVVDSTRRYYKGRYRTQIIVGIITVLANLAVVIPIRVTQDANTARSQCQNRAFNTIITDLHNLVKDPHATFPLPEQCK